MSNGNDFVSHAAVLDHVALTLSSREQYKELILLAISRRYHVQTVTWLPLSSRSKADSNPGRADRPELSSQGESRYDFSFLQVGGGLGYVLHLAFFYG